MKGSNNPGDMEVCVCVTFVSELSCTSRVLANGRFFTQEDLPNVCKQSSLNETSRPHRPRNATDIQSKCAASSLCNFLNHPQLFFLRIRPKYSPHNFLLKPYSWSYSLTASNHVSCPHKRSKPIVLFILIFRVLGNKRRDNNKQVWIQ
jgi:hypothetical protein